MISALGLGAAAAFSPQLDLPSGLPLAAAAASSPKLVSLHDLHSGLFVSAAAALFPQLVSLHDRVCLVPLLFVIFGTLGG